MKYKFLVLTTAVFLLVNCKKQEFQEFDFSYGNTFETDFSIKFSSDNDSVLIRENWSANNSRKPLSKTNYISRLSKLQNKKLDSFIKNINFASFDTFIF